ncbi:MAG: phosphatase PAP2 family protein, partial [Proteobacteria bacterium]|nr:phosphatase PAP2 family protein [Pseudomonadota bacterium]
MTFSSESIEPQSERTGETRPKTGGFGADLLAVLRDHRVFIALILGYTLAGWVTTSLLGAEERFVPLLYSETMAIIIGLFLVAFFGGYPIYVMVVVRPKRLTAYIVANMGDRFLTRRLLLAALPVFVFIPVLLGVVTSLKSLIPAMNPYGWDVTFAAWDRTLHGGVDPWRLLQPLLGHPLVSASINLGYNSWLAVLYIVLLWQAFSTRDPRLRMQFLLTFVLAWIVLGTFAATALSSVGPVYFGRVTGAEDSFAPLMAYLQSVNEIYPVGALNAQEYLWKVYQEGGYAPGSGISAMPSLHVAMVFLFALV